MFALNLAGLCRRAVPCRPLAVAVIAAMWLGPAEAHGDDGPPEPPRVTVIHAYHQGMGWTDRLQKGLATALHEGGDVDIDVHYLDRKRRPGDELEAEHLALLAAKRETHPPDVVVLSDNHALDFVREHRQTLYPETPVVFCGINHFDPSMLDGSGLFTGVTEDTDAASTFELIRDLRPGLERCIVVMDDTATGRYELAAAREALGDQRDGVTMEYWSGKSMGQLRERLSGLDPETDAVLLATFNRDANGDYFDDTRGVERIVAASAAPVFGLWDFYLSAGVIGGRMVSPSEQGRVAGEIARRLLEGATPEATGLVRASPNRTAVHYPTLERFGIEPTDVPAGVEIVARPVDPWVEHRATVVALSALVVGEAVVLGVPALLLLRHRRRAARRVEASEQQLRNTLEGSPNCVQLFDDRGVVVWVNGSGMKAVGPEGGAVVGVPFAELWPEPVRAQAKQAMAAALDGQRVDFEAAGHPRDGETRVWWVRLSPLFDDAHRRVEQVVGISTDVTERCKEQAQLRQLSEAVEQMASSVVITDREGYIEYVNPAFTRHTGYTSEEAIGQSPSVLKSGNMSRETYEALWNTIASGRTWRGELQNRRKDGSMFWELATIAPIRDHGGEITHYVAVKEEISRQKSAEYRLMVAAHTDRLTGLANRAGFCDQAEQVLARARYDSASWVAMLFLDIDRFKTVNDTFGHDVGDALLNQIAVRMCEIMNCTDPLSAEADQCVIARFSSDEYIALMGGVRDAEQAHALAQRVLDKVSLPYTVNGHEVTLVFNLGLRITEPKQAPSVTELLRDADIALHEAKGNGEGRVTVFDESMRQRVQRRLLLENDLRKAVLQGELSLVYQPVVCLTSGRIYAYEALARWNHPVHGMISPGEFIPIAEDTGLIFGLGMWALRTACTQYMNWLQTGVFQTPAYEGPPVMNVNLSPDQLSYPGITDQCRTILDETAMPADRLCLEVTESTVMRDTEQAVRVLEDLKAPGIRLALDDFGTGYSSLSCVPRLPIDTIKIDRSFVMGMVENRDFAAMVHTVSVLAENLGLKVVGEGVETREHSTMLQAFDCQYGQGYLFAKPMPAKEIPGFAIDASLFEVVSDAA